MAWDRGRWTAAGRDLESVVLSHRSMHKYRPASAVYASWFVSPNAPMSGAGVRSTKVCAPLAG